MPTATSAVRPSSSAAVGKPTVNPSTDRPTIWLAPDCTPARSSSGAQRDALPQGVAHQVAAHLVGHARQGHRLLDLGHVLEVVEGHGEGVVDHAGDRQLPAGHVDLRDDQRGVDAVEVARWAPGRGSGRRPGTRPCPGASKAAGEPGGTAWLVGRTRRIFSRAASTEDRPRRARPASAPVTAKAPAAPAQPRKARRVAAASVGRATTGRVGPAGRRRRGGRAAGARWWPRGAGRTGCPARRPRPAPAATTATPVEARGSRALATMPTTPKAANPTMATHRRRRLAVPSAAPDQQRHDHDADDQRRLVGRAQHADGRAGHARRPTRG